MSDKILALSIVARDEASAAIGKIESSLGRLGIKAGTTDDAMKGLMKGLIGLGTTVVAYEAVQKLTGFLTDSVKAAIEEEKGINRLTASLKANAPAWNGNSDAIERVVAGRQRLAFSDGDLRDSLSQLVGVTHDVNQAFNVQSVAMDLARFKGISLQEASVALTRVEAGKYRALADLGIVLKAGATQVEALAAVEKVAAGQADAYAKSQAGALDRAGVAIENFQEKLGGKFAPAVANAADAGTNLLNSLDHLDIAFDAATGHMDEAKAKLQELADAENGVIQTTNDLARATLLAAEAADRDMEKNHGLYASLDETINATHTFTVAGETLADRLNDLEKLYPGLIGYTDGFGGALYTTAQQAYGLATALDTTAAHYAMLAATFAASVIPGIRVPGMDFGTASQTQAQAAAEAAAQTQARADLAIARTQAQAAAAAEAERKAAAAARKGASAGAAQAKKDAAELAREIAAAYAEAQKAGDAYFDTVHKQNLKALSDAHNIATAKIEGEHKAAQAAIDAAHTAANAWITNARRAVDAQLADRMRLDAAPVTAAEAALQATQNAQQLRDLQEALTAAQAGGDPKALRSAQEALSNFLAQQSIDALKAQQAQADEQAQKDAAAAQAELDKQQKAADDTYQSQKDAEQATYDTRKAAEDASYAKKQALEDSRWALQKKVFDDHTAALAASSAASIKLANAETLRYLQEAVVLAKADGNKYDVALAQHELSDFLKSISHHAAGGWVGLDGPELSWVGERGPERIIPNGGSVGGHVFQVHMNATGSLSRAQAQENAKEIMQALIREARRQGVSISG